MKKKFPYVAAAVLVLALTLAFAAVWSSLKATREVRARDEKARLARIHQVNMINRAQCAALSNVYELLRSTIQASDRRLDNIQYYREHPGERADAHAANRAILRRFRTPPCPSTVALPTP